MARLSIRERFWSKVTKGEDCWLWKASTDDKGYGIFHLAGKVKRAHTVAYELTRGLVPENLELDHLCRNTLCVNPEHLEPVTHRENMARGLGISAINAKKTHCPKGHPLEGDNLIRFDLEKRGRRSCRTCANARTLAYVMGKYWAKKKLVAS